jgi:tetratricopeptide (TPR) repeat protein
MDPLTLPVILCGFAVPFISKEKRHLALAAGGACYLIYVVKIGGDFMSGRFTTASLFCAVAILASTPLASLRSGLLAISIVGLLGLWSPYSPMRTGADYGLDPEHLALRRGIADERAHYQQHAGLINAKQNGGEPQHLFAIRGRRRARLRQDHDRAPLVCGNIGYYGFYAGRDLHLVDRHALADPLLSRLPTINTGAWRIGHFKRAIPNGYLKTLETGENQIANPGLSAYYDRLSRVTRGDLFDPNRWAEIWNLNVGKYDHLIRPQFEFAQYHSLASLLSAQGHMEEALNAQKKSASIDPTRSEGWAGLSGIYRRVGDLKEAYKALAKAIALSPGDLDHRIEYLNLGKAYHDRGETDKAFTIYREARKTAPLVEVYLSSGNLLYEQGYPDRALEVYQQVLNGKLKTARYSRRSNSDPALGYRQKRLAVAHFGIARILYDRGKIKEAVQECEQALALDPTHPEARRKLQTLLASL